MVFISSRPASRRVFHTESNCPYKQKIRDGNLMEVSEEKAERMGLEPCAWCKVGPPEIESEDDWHWRAAQNAEATIDTSE